MDKLKKLYSAQREAILYIVFGGATTGVNFVVFWLCKWLLPTTPTTNNAIAWAMSVTFAYIVNKLFVFNSRNTAPRVVLVELTSFVGARFISGFAETLAIYVFVEKLGANDMLVKVIAAVIVVLLNYIFSRLIVFKKRA